MAGSRYSSRPRLVAVPSAPRNPSGTYQELAAILERYVSPIVVHATLKNAIDMLSLRPDMVDSRDAERVVERTMIGLRLFCDTDKLPGLMLELADYCHRVRQP